MKIHGVIESGVPIRTNIDFDCIKCGEHVPISVNGSDSPMNQMFLSMAKEELCFYCHCDSVVPKLAEVILQ